MSSTSLNAFELDTLKKFRKTVEDILEPKHDDEFLLRWLRARNFRIGDAEVMLRKSISWRKSFQVDNIRQTYNKEEVVKIYWPFRIIGNDKEGCPVWFLQYGEFDIKGMMLSVKKSNLLTAFIYDAEENEAKYREQTEKLGKQVNSSILIIDVNNFALYQIVWRPAFDILKSAISIYEDNYPERLKKVYIINAPSIFHIGLALLKPFIDERTFKKIRVFGKDGWKSKLLEEIDEYVLPIQYGGKRISSSGDINSYDLVPKAGKIPIQYYMQTTLSNEKDAVTLQIRPRSIRQIDILVSCPNSVLNWEFKTEGYDICFGFGYKQHNTIEDIISIQKVSCHLVPENGSYLCTKTGIYVLTFDNSFSWIRSKTLKFRTEVIQPNEE